MADKEELNKWIVLAVAALSYFLIAASIAMSSVLLIDLLRAYPDYTRLLTWLSGTNISIGAICSVLAGFVLTRCPRHIVGIVAALVLTSALIITSFSNSPVVMFMMFGVLAGLCNSVYFTLPMVSLQKCFASRRNFAQGVLFATQSFAMLTYPPVVRMVADHFTWRGMLLLQAGINLHVIPGYLLTRDRHSHCAKQCTTYEEEVFVTKPIKSDKNSEKEDKSIQETTNIDISRTLLEQTKTNNNSLHKSSDPYISIKKTTANNSLTAMFIERPLSLFFLVAMVMVQSGNIIPFTLTPLHAEYQGYSDLNGALLITIASGISFIGRVVFGYIGDRQWSSSLLMCATGAILGGILTVIVPMLSEYIHLALLIASIAFPSACFMATWGGSLAMIVGQHHLVLGMSTGLSAFGVGNLLPFTITGWLLEFFGSPTYIFLIFGSSEILGGLVFLSIYIRRKYSKPLN